MSDLPARLRRLGSTIEQLMTIGGSPGLALGIVTKGKEPYFANYGFRDVDKKDPVTEDTVFPIASLSKAFTATALGLLVEEGKLSWDTLVKDALPSFEPVNDTLKTTTITDILCHRTGMGWADNLIIGTDGNILLDHQDLMKFINHRPLQVPFRSQFGYNNLHFEIAGQAVEKITGKSYSDYMQHSVLEPLGMDRTFFSTPPKDVDNQSQCYNALDDSSTTEVPCVKMGDNGYGSPSGGVRSTAKDLLKFYQALTTGFNEQFDTDATESKTSALKQCEHILSAKIPIDQPTKNEASYGFGWARVQLPGRMGQIGLNPGLVPNAMPLVGRGSAQLVIFHQGSLPGTLTLAALLPEIDTAIVVLSNSLALTDVADWVGQLVIEEILEVPSGLRNDFVGYAKEAVKENLKWYPSVIEELEKGQKSGTSPKPLKEYVGTYWDDLKIVKIVVTLEDDKLFWLIQGLETEKFELKHYQDNTFTWLLPRNELSKRGRWVGSDQDATFWKAEFSSSKNGKIDKLTWAHDGGVPPATYTKVKGTHQLSMPGTRRSWMKQLSMLTRAKGSL